MHNFSSQFSFTIKLFLSTLPSGEHPTMRTDWSALRVVSTHLNTHWHTERAHIHTSTHTHTEGAYQASFRHAQHAAGGSRKRKPCPDEYRGAASADLVRVDKIDPAVDDCSRAFEGITVPDWHWQWHQLTHILSWIDKNSISSVIKSSFNVGTSVSYIEKGRQDDKGANER